MALQKRKNSANWHYFFQYKGQRYQGSTGTANRTKALQVERDIRAKLHGQHYLGEAETISLIDAMRQYVEARQDQASYKGRLSIINKVQGFKLDPKTLAKHRCYGLSPAMQLHELQTKDIERLVQRRRAEGDKPATIKHELGLIRATVLEMKRLGYRVNPDIVFPTIKTQYRLRYLDESEEAALLRELDPASKFNGLTPQESRTSEMQRNLQDNYDLVVFLLDTGCRYSEAANLPWSAVHLETNTIHLFRSKVRNEDVLYLTDRLKQVLQRRWEQRRQGQRYLFENKLGQERGYAPQAIRKAIDRAGLNDPNVVKEKGGKVTIHTLRHSYASKLVKLGLSLYEVSVLLGHQDTSMTRRYAHLAPNEASRKAVDIINQMQAVGVDAAR